MGHFVDLSTWKRREHFQLYQGFANPFFSVCADVDVTALIRECRQTGGPSFFLSALFCALRAINANEAMRLRIRGDRVWLHDRVRASATVLRDDETFGFGRFELTDTFDEFHQKGRAEIERVKVSTTLEPARDQDDLVYQSTIPWIRLTSFTNPVSSPPDSIPKFVFGKCSRAGDGHAMPVAVEVHHGLVDGLDAGLFYERFQREMSGLF